MSNKRLSIIIGAIDKISGPMAAISSKIEKIKAPTDRLNRSLNKLGRQSGLRKFNRELRNTAKHARNAGRSIASAAKIGAGLAAVGGGAVFGLATSYANAGDNIAKTSHRLGLGVEALQEYRYAADRSGIAQATFDMATQRFGRRIGEASKGMGEARSAIKALGLELKDSAGNMRSTESLMTEALDKLGKVEEPLVRNALAMKLFDSEGLKMVQMTKDGAEGIAQLRAEARQLGLVIDEDAAKASENFVDKLTNIQSAVTGLRNRIGQHLVPALAPLIESLTTLAVKYGPQVSAWAADFAKNLPSHIENISNMFSGMVTALQPVINIAMWVSENFGIINSVLAVTATVIGFQVVAAVVSLAASFKALGIAIALTPIGWIAGGIAAVVGLSVLLYKNWDKVKQGFIIAAKAIIKYNPFSLLIQGVDKLIKMFTGFGVLDSLRSKLENLLPDWALDLLDSDDPKSVKAPIPNNKSEFAGRLEIDVTGERPKVTALESTSSDMDIEVNAGFMMAGP